MTIVSGLTADSASTVARSQWKEVDTDVPTGLALLHAEFKQEDAGIQGLFEFEPFLCATGLNKVVLVGQIESKGKETVAQFKNGVIDTVLDPSCAVLSMSGGELEKLVR